MVKHIAVGLDGSANAAAAERLALDLARRLHAVLHGIHVVDATFLEGAFITDISGAMGFEPFLNLQAQMRATLDDVAGVIRDDFTARCEAAGVEGEFHLERAGVVHGILAAGKLAELFVVGQRGVNARFHEDLLGSAAELLLRRSPLPVLIVHQDSETPRRPLVAYDGSPKAVRALQHAAELARALGLALAVVTVDQQEERARARLDEAARYLAPYDVQVTFEFRHGEEVEKELLAMAQPEGFDLLFLGAHGHGRIVELALGSTSQYVARRAAVPVWCVTRA
ncbi:MAG TPA: universal stress protein [Thermoanaerobaculaceae bacterium]|nr:universal stress protein [Thermoanaerobaculaceae bacterium]